MIVLVITTTFFFVGFLQSSSAQTRLSNCNAFYEQTGERIVGYQTWDDMAADLSYAQLVADNFMGEGGGKYVLCPGLSFYPVETAGRPAVISALNTVVMCGGGRTDCIVELQPNLPAFFVMKSNWVVSGVRFEGITFQESDNRDGDEGLLSSMAPAVWIGLPSVTSSGVGKPEVSFLNCHWKSISSHPSAVLISRVDEDWSDSSRSLNNSIYERPPEKGMSSNVNFELCTFTVSILKARFVLKFTSMILCSGIRFSVQSFLFSFSLQ
uniref:Uncharacterized protein n=1 Tax=Corethron hystrix TaxID=216773 RepID=A0A7S1FLC5_9STRA|mmetsp:Transcript_13445/g.29705  ORF Transcript_13445/g.29705 Transcript_13445/m.29705 type:complete len:267 (+) Transcript_13445:157-957(+)